jgi:hypothetical protein
MGEEIYLGRRGLILESAMRPENGVSLEVTLWVGWVIRKNRDRNYEWARALELSTRKLF